MIVPQNRRALHRIFDLFTVSLKMAEIGPSGTLAAAFRIALPESPSHFAEQNASPLSKGAFCELHRTKKAPLEVSRGDVCERCLWQSKRAKRSGSGRQAASEAKLTPGTATGAVCAKRRLRGF